MSNRFIYDNENDLVKPKATCACYTCAYRNKKVKDGYARGRCEKYAKPNWKPNDVLFHDKKCEFYKKEGKSSSLRVRLINLIHFKIGKAKKEK